MVVDSEIFEKGREGPNPERIREKFGILADAVFAFGSGEIGRREYKGVSGGFGTYAQRAEGKHMVRLRLAGGRLTEDKLAFIVECVNKYGLDMIHFTTCQTVQLHNLSPEGALGVVRDALDAGIITYGGGGDFPRNVTASPLSGVDPAEAFDVSPFVLATEGYLLGVAPYANLPRKLKVAFSNGTDDVHATVRDLGFVARRDGRFDVYAAGGLGGVGSRHGALVVNGLDPADALYCVEAMVSVFMEHGNRDSRTRARTRFIRDSLGEEGFLRAFSEALGESRSRGGLSLDVPLSMGSPGGNAVKWPLAQKNGLYAVRHRPVGGNPDVGNLERYLKVLTDNPGSEIRLSTDRAMYFINLGKDAAEALGDSLGDGAETDFQGSIACVGGTICQTGNVDSRGILADLLDANPGEGLADGALPQIRISGCASSCSSHQTAPLGFRGASAKGPAGNVPGFEVFYRTGGSLAKSAGTIPAKNMSTFLGDLGKAVSPERFEEWISRNEGRFLEILERHSMV